jgi:phosphoserine phosphatase
MNRSLLSAGRHCATAFIKNARVKNVISNSIKMPMSSIDDRTFSTSGIDIMSHFSNDKLEGQNIASAMESLAKADAVCFDVDSTVIQEEGIDVLAASLGKGKEVSAWTLKAMEGDTKFEDALAARLDIIKPSRASILKCLEDHPLQLSPGVDRLVEVLMENGTDVYLVSGGFRIMIEPVAKTLCISKTNIFANNIFFDENTETGEYTGFCRDEPTSADMGKPKAVQMIKDQHDYETVVMVGDGATDAQAKPPADAFIGFGGVAVRDAVKQKACWYVYDFEDMIKVVEKFGKNKK